MNVNLINKFKRYNFFHSHCNKNLSIKKISEKPQKFIEGFAQNSLYKNDENSNKLEYCSSWTSQFSLHIKGEEAISKRA